MASHPKHKKDIDFEFKSKIRELPCIVCGAPPPSTVSHIKTRGSGGGDDAWNIVPKCGTCHREWEDNKSMFLLKHSGFAKHLTELGWVWWETRGKFYLLHDKT